MLTDIIILHSNCLFFQPPNEQCRLKYKCVFFTDFLKRTDLATFSMFFSLNSLCWMSPSLKLSNWVLLNEVTSHFCGAEARQAFHGMLLPKRLCCSKQCFSYIHFQLLSAAEYNRLTMQKAPSSQISFQFHKQSYMKFPDHFAHIAYIIANISTSK